MPKSTPTPRLADVISSETQEIMNKAVLRTALFAEKFYPPTTDDRDPLILAYEAEHFDNPESPLYQDDGAAYVWAALKGVKNPTFRYTESKSVRLQLGVVVVPVNTRFQTHREGIKVGTPYVCVNSSHNKFRGMDGEKVQMDLNSLSVRPATQDEIETLVSALMSIRPAQTIKVLGNALDNSDGDE